MQFIKDRIRGSLRKLGYEISWYNPNPQWVDPFKDMAGILAGVGQPMILDVGANVGQSVTKFRAAMPGATIHSFEPSPTTFAKLKQHCEGLANVQTWNNGVGATAGTLPLIENSYSDMSSFLAPGTASWGKVEQTTNVPVVTLDDFADREKIDHIHVLKSDTQGFDLEVFKGAQGLMRAGRIQLIFYEAILSTMYEGLPPYHDVLKFLAEQGFRPVSIYKQHYQHGLLSHMDVLLAAQKRSR